MWRVTVSIMIILPMVSTQSSAPVRVKGVETGIQSNGARPSRLNINDMYSRGGPQWDLYIQALSSMQKVPETDETSYYQLAGIHGLPFVPWNGVSQVPGAPDIGYCPHGELLFASWHRPYVALFEQVLVLHAHSIASKYPVKVAATYRRAADALRQPYWDWATDHNLPAAVILETIIVNGPDGPNTVPNPLYSYRFQNPPNGSGFGGPLASYPATVRCPMQGSLENNVALSDSMLNLETAALTSLTYDVFTRAQTFESMASVGTPGPSFEAPHNNVHALAGCGNGTMADIGWSAFDPLFMLHHCNVDRLISMWQAIHFNASMLTTTGTSHGEFGTAPGTVTGPESPLKPFFDTDLNFHTSHTVTHIAALGYTYPEIDDWSTTPEQLAERVTRRVNALYAPTAPNSSRTWTITPTLKHRDNGLQPGWSYSVEIRVDRRDVPLPCTLIVLLGSRAVGSVALLGTPSAISAAAYASVPLRDALARAPEIAKLPVEERVTILRQSLCVEVRKNDGSLIAIDSLPSLRAELQDQDFAPRTIDAELPRYGRVTRWPLSGQFKMF